VGRESELGVLREFARDDRPLRSLLLSGSPGIGKTTLWEAGVEVARESGLRVLSSRPSGAEAQLSFAALIDLLDGIDIAALPGLPGPQRRALEVALMRVEPGLEPPAPDASAVGFLHALRILAADQPLLLAIDDVQWLDLPSAQVLAFAARRLEDSATAFLLARRPGPSSTLERVLERKALERLAVLPLSLGAIRQILSERLGLSLPRQLLRRVVDATLGNPLFALEVGRTLVEQGLPAIGEDIPAPDAVEDLLGTRVARLSASLRRLLLAVALDAELRMSQLAEIADLADVEEAVEAGLLVVEGERVRASHPLLAAAARQRSRPDGRRELHRELARVAVDEELRARHLALAAKRPDEQLAATVAAAAAAASARGARQEAVELGEHALRLTPHGAAERTDRLLSLAGYLEAAGEKQRATDLLAPVLDSLPAGPARVKALLTLTAGLIRSDEDIERYYERALVESRSDPVLHATLLLRRAQNMAVHGVARIAEADAWAEEALPLSRRAGPDAERVVLDGLAWTRALRGRPIDDVCERFRAISDAATYIASSPERVAAQRLAWRGEIGHARAALMHLQSLADERLELVSDVTLRLHLCELELRAGELEAASGLLEEWGDSSERESISTQYERCRALLAAARGHPDEAEWWAAKTIAGTEATGTRWDLLEAWRARGLAALLANDPAAAAESLRSVWEHTQREGVDDPGVFPVAPELVEALVGLGELDEAHAVTNRLSELAREQEHPWGLATAKRCQALVRLGSERAGEAAVELEEASLAYGDLGLRFDRARTLLLLGRDQRRRKQWAGARNALERATAAFDELGSPGWAEEAHSELARVSGRRRRAAGELTPAEERVVELAVQGLSNKEIAQKLVVAVNTVEVHLSHAYAKLGVRSRSQLAGARSAQA
jgi:DNA-binding CsgD family transcriptional regulator